MYCIRELIVFIYQLRKAAICCGLNHVSIARNKAKRQFNFTHGLLLTRIYVVDCFTKRKLQIDIGLFK